VRLRSRSTRIGLVLLSALLSRACCPPFDLGALAFVCWLPLLLAFELAAWRERVLLGWLQGIVTNLLAFHWMASPVHDVAGLSWPAAAGALVVLCAWQGLRVAALAASYGLVVMSAGRLRPLAFGALLALVESAFPMAFPWGTHGFVHAQPIWAQAASIGGAALVTACFGFVNEALLSVVAPVARADRAWPAVAAFVALTSFGWWRMRQVDTQGERAPRSRVLVVQGNLLPARQEKRDPAVVYHDATLAALAREPRVDWIAWPETAVFYATPAVNLGPLFRNVLLRNRLRGPQAPRIEKPLVTGLVLQEGSARFNSVVAAAANGSPSGRYDKRLLVPLGETRSEGDGPPVFAAPHAEAEHQPLSVVGHRIAAFICFEALNESRVFEAMSGGRAALLLNPTSDAWFAGSIGPHMHLAFATIRAIEHQRYLLRPTTTGKTVLIDPAGRTVWSLPEGQASSGTAEFSWLEPVTVFGKLGSTPFTLGYLGLSIAFALNGLRQRRVKVLSETV
jgi:apolipoprotein N-acyltransferase